MKALFLAGFTSLLLCGAHVRRLPDRPEMIRIAGGRFSMGDAGGNADEKPVHTETVGRFWVGKTEVTLAQFALFVEKTGYRTDAETGDGSYIWTALGWQKQAGVNWRHDEKGALRPAGQQNFPVMHVSWRDAAQYCNWLSNLEHRPVVYGFEADSVLVLDHATGYCLPTESEWEYAAGGGSPVKPRYAGGDEIGALGWYAGNSNKGAHAVALKKPNSFGLYDCSGNVWEWCQNRHDAAGYRQESDSLRSKGNAGDGQRVIRGGSWSNNPSHCRITNRSARFPDSRDCNLGFRVARH